MFPRHTCPSSLFFFYIGIVFVLFSPLSRFRCCFFIHTHFRYEVGRNNIVWFLVGQNETLDCLLIVYLFFFSRIQLKPMRRYRRDLPDRLENMIISHAEQHRLDSVSSCILLMEWTPCFCKRCFTVHAHHWVPSHQSAARSLRLIGRAVGGIIYQRRSRKPRASGRFTIFWSMFNRRVKSSNAPVSSKTDSYRCWYWPGSTPGTMRVE